MTLDKYSIGMGDRFACEGDAQLSAIVRASELGVKVTPVWNKSHREHTIIGTTPASVRKEADAAVKKAGWKGQYFCDADHIGLKNVDLFMDACDFFTLDVADFTGQAAAPDAIRDFAEKYAGYARSLKIPGLADPLVISRGMIDETARKYLLAVQEAGRIYRHIKAKKGGDGFVAEVSMDETVSAQTPSEMLVILAAIAEEKIPAQTIAPKFTGRFNKGVDYVGDIAQFTKEFEADLAVIAFAVKEFKLPKNLKLSVHSGSDKFSIYKPINNAITKSGAGLHLKTAGTTWLEEVIGLATAGGDGLEIAKAIYLKARPRFEELCKPYATVIDINPANLPSEADIGRWTGREFADALRHDQKCGAFNRDFRQFVHVSFRVAAEMGETYIAALKTNREVIADNVRTNLLERHIKPVFMQE